MRWRFAEDRNELEARFREQTLAAIDAFWQEFAGVTGELDALFRREADWDLPGWMEQHLSAVRPELMWEFGRALAIDGHRLVITPESVRTLRPLVATMLERAPRLTGWEFYAHRVPENLEMALATVEARCGAAALPFSCEVTRGDGNLVNLEFQAPGIEDGDEDAHRQAFVLTETLLGEEILDRWIGVIGVSGRPSTRLSRWLGRRSEKPALTDLAERVAALRGEILGELPDRPWYERAEGEGWSLLKLEPVQADDYPEQTDLFVARTPSVPLWRATRSDFSDARFSRRGETFCYLKLDGSEGLDEEKFADKSEIEDALDAVLVPARVGCQIGGGTGLRYSYIELALTDVERAVELVKQRLREGNVPRRSWILFHDAELKDEWIGVYDETPPPPR